MFAANFAKDVTSIFNSDLPEGLKYDVTCRLVCETLQAASVSMLMYEGRTDQLVAKGCYINPEKMGCNFGGDLILEDIAKNIAVCEFLFHRIKLSDESVTCEDFTRSCIYGKTSKISSCNQSQFEVFKNKWESNSFKTTYQRFKTTIHSERYDISEGSISGSFFLSLLVEGDNLSNPAKVTKLTKETIGIAHYIDLLKSGGISISPSFIYIGLPLFNTERYTGILRILVGRNAFSHLPYITNRNDSLDDIESFELTEEYAEELSNFPQLISLHLETMYFLDAYKTLTTLQIDLRNLSEICENITTILNCKGVMMRLKNDSTDKLEIAGYSSEMKDYVAFVETKYEGIPELHSKEFSRSLVQIFATEQHKNNPLRAINFKIKDALSNQFDTIEYYFDKNKDLKKANSKRILSDFEPGYNNGLLELGIIELVVLPLPFVDDAYMILTNSKHRTFSMFDIEMVLLAAKRTGSEFKQTQDIKNMKIIEKQQVFMSSMRIIVHQFGTLVATSSNQIHNILRNNILNSASDNFTFNKYDIENFRKKVTELVFVVNQSKRQLLRSKRIIELEDKKPIEVHKTKIENFKRALINKCKDFEINAYTEKKLHVWLIDLGESVRSFETDDELFDEVIYNILDNAIKYSYDAQEMKKKISGFDETVYFSEGNILMHYSNNYDKLVIKVTNWGATVSTHEKDKIFDNYYRGTNSKNIVGSGIGLYLVKKIVEALNGKIEVSLGKDKTIFTLTFNR